jgi:subtilase family serine protease
MAALAAGGLVLAGASSVAAAPGGRSAVHAHHVCAAGKDGAANCHSWVVTDAKGKPEASTSVTGLDPAAIKTAYTYPTSTTAGSGTTIAIVDAYHDPTALSDLNTFSKQFGLPLCDAANPCFKQVNQSGGTKAPRTDSGWALEISLDVQWAHAIAPGAKILLVEAGSNSFSNLMAAEDYAAGHAQYVSNSWGGSEFSGESSYDSHFSAPGVSYFVSAGDAGLPAEYPSSSPNVISVGGTSLATTPESVWSEGGGGCSTYETAAAAQSSFAEYAQVNCKGKRATPDLSLDADPASGVAVYDSTSYQGQTGWFKVGGTSASSPMVAAHAATIGAQVNAGYVYGLPDSAFREIDSGSNGATCLTGFDLCAGRGSWLG